MPLVGNEMKPHLSAEVLKLVVETCLRHLFFVYNACLSREYFFLFVSKFFTEPPVVGFASCRAVLKMSIYLYPGLLGVLKTSSVKFQCFVEHVLFCESACFVCECSILI